MARSLLKTFNRFLNATLAGGVFRFDFFNLSAQLSGSLFFLGLKLVSGLT